MCKLILVIKFKNRRFDESLSPVLSEADVNKLKSILQGTEVFLICQNKIACWFSRTINNYNNVRRMFKIDKIRMLKTS